MKSSFIDIPKVMLELRGDIFVDPNHVILAKDIISINMLRDISRNASLNGYTVDGNTRIVRTEIELCEDHDKISPSRINNGNIKFEGAEKTPMIMPSLCTELPIEVFGGLKDGDKFTYRFQTSGHFTWSYATIDLYVVMNLQILECRWPYGHYRTSESFEKIIQRLKERRLE